MDYSFPRYLLSKQTVDDRALNKDVVQALRKQLREPVSTVEVGAGIGTMLRRLVDWGILCVGEYVLVDGMAENIAYAREWIPQWAAEAGLVVEGTGPGQLRICDRDRDIRIRLECADVFDFIAANERPPVDLLIAHAFLDLLPLPASLGKLLQLTKSLAWLTINFDGVSAFQPEIDPVLDEQIERLYHATMDRRLTGGDSRTGRKLFTQIGSAGAEILAAGASDWIVYPHGHEYPAEEKYFLGFILGFFEEALDGCDELDASQFKDWLARRQEQIEHGELVYIAHQMDFLVRKRS